MLEKLLEKNPEGILSAILPKLKNLPSSFLKGSLQLLDQDTKDELAAYFLNENRESIVKVINQIAAEKGISLDVSELEIRKSTPEQTAKESEYRKEEES